MIEIITNIEQAMRQLQGIFSRKKQQIKEATKSSVIRSATIVQEEVIQSIKDEQAVASGALLESVTIGRMTQSTEGVEISVGSSSPYAKFVEEGVRAGGRQPPSSKIYEWMIQKGMEPSQSGAYLIGKAIAARGIPAKHPFEKGARKAEARIDREINVIFDTTLTKE